MSYEILSKDDVISVGFGDASLTKNGECIWYEKGGMEFEDCMTVEQAEDITSKDPNHDWRIILFGPLRGRVYQRQGPMNWTLIEKNNGFA